MTVIDLSQAMLRGAHIAALLSLYGTLMFLIVVAPAAFAEAGAAAEATRRRLLYLALVSTVCAIVFGVGWLTIQTALIAGTDSIATMLRALPVVALQTQFGQWLSLRLLLLVLLSVGLRWRRSSPAVAIVPAMIALCLQPLLGHAGAMGGSAGAVLVISEMLHLLAAGAWLGALLPLYITVGALPAGAAATACRGFTPVGLAAVAILAATAALQVTELMGGLAGLLGTAYGHIALVKLALFLLLLALAALNRLALTDRLAVANAHPMMRLSIALETTLGLLVVAAAAALASRTPGTHEQPVWPFPWRLSFDALTDADLRPELLGASLVVMGAIAIGVVAVWWQRWPLLAIALAMFVLGSRHFGLLLVEAYPTSFFTSPTEFAASAISHGGALFQQHCAVCHGAEGHGDGPAAKGLSIPPADLTAEHLWGHNDGEMYWYLSHGYDNPEGGLAMPGFATALSSDARWDLIDYLRAYNAGAAMRHTNGWPHPVQVPQFDADCADGRTIDLDDLRGRALLIIAGAADVPVANVTILYLTARDQKPTGHDCVAREPATWNAFAILAGMPVDALSGTRFLADGNGWLRVLWRPGVAVDAKQVADIAAHPLGFDSPGGQVHHH